MTRTQIETELQAAQRELETAIQRRQNAEHALWDTVRRSGQVAVQIEEVDDARRELADAEQGLSQAETLLAELQARLQRAQEREERLLAITDMLMARDKARGTIGGEKVDAPEQKPAVPRRRRSLLGRLFGR